MLETIFNFFSGLSSSLLQTLPLIPASIGFYIALRSLRFPDLTVEGSFVFGSVLSAVFIQEGWSPILAILVASIGGMICGLLTAFWHIKLKIPPFVSGIITTFIFTSLNFGLLKVISKTSGTVDSLNLDNKGIFNWVNEYDNNTGSALGQLRFVELLSLILIVLIVVAISYYILKSKNGLLMRAFGAHRTAGKIYDKKYYFSIFFGLAFANSLVAISGAIAAQFNGNASISSGTTLLIPLLAAVVCGEFVVDFVYSKKIRKRKTTKPLLSRPLGIAFAPFLGFVIFNLIVLVFGAIIIPMANNKNSWLDSYHKYWIIALFIIGILAIKKNDISEQYSDDLI
jgi:putative tryptophan/tyrosine transport system permease protein